MIGIGLFALVGVVLGIAHFAALRWSVAAFLRGRRGIIAWYVARLVGVALILFALVRIGGPLVLATLAGFLVARTVFVRRVRAGPEAS